MNDITARDDSWTAEWTCSKLLEHTGIEKAIPLNGNSVRLVLTENREVKVATMSADVVQTIDVANLCSNTSTEFLLNIKKEAVIRRETLEVAAAIPVGIGSVGDLYTAVNEKQFRQYLPKETRYIMRGLRQHSAVSDIIRLTNRLYLVERGLRAAVRVLALNEYDLSADALRTGVERHGRPNCILMSNPNCRPTSQAVIASQSLGARLLRWGELLGALNH